MCSPMVHRPRAASSRSAATCWSRSCPGRATTSRTRSSSANRSSVRTSTPRSTSRSSRSRRATPSSVPRRSPAIFPNINEESLKNLNERGIIYVGAEVHPGDILVGKITPKGESELSAEERLLRAIFGEKAREVRDSSLRVPHGERGIVVDVKVFSRESNHELPPGVNELVRVYVAQKRKIAAGRQDVRPARQQGRRRPHHAHRGHAVPAGRNAGGDRAQPARCAEPHEPRSGAGNASWLCGACTRTQGRVAGLRRCLRGAHRK